jgi:NAD(P)-dependent dehydrogenase (short-subunit alcohol dehydrogenase family)
MRTLLLTGAAEGLGTCLVETFAGAGYAVLGLSRTDRAEHLRRRVEQAGGRYTHLVCDLTQPADVTAILGPFADRIDVLIHNAHILTIKPFAETTASEFEQAWRVACLGAMMSVQIVVSHMAARRQGTIILTGATAALRGASNFAAFASAKFALRGLAQSLAREFGPQGIHVVLDGLIDELQTDRRFGSSPAGRMDPQSIARCYLDLTMQQRSAWTHEMDLRPFSEKILGRY